MPEISIPLAEKATRPAIPAKDFNETYLMDFSIRAHTMGEEDALYGEYVPYDQATGERLLSDRREVRLPFWEVVQNIPSAKAAYAAWAAAWPDIVAYQEARKA